MNTAIHDATSPLSRQCRANVSIAEPVLDMGAVGDSDATAVTGQGFLALNVRDILDRSDIWHGTER